MQKGYSIKLCQIIICYFHIDILLIISLSFHFPQSIFDITTEYYK